MRKTKIKIDVHKEAKGYSASATVGEYFIATEGNSYTDLKNNILEAVNLAFEEEKQTYTFDDIKLNIELQSFFEFFKVINVKALGERIGMSQSLLAQYINGIKKPSKKQSERIFNGINELANELLEVRLVS